PTDGARKGANDSRRVLPASSRQEVSELLRHPRILFILAEPRSALPRTLYNRPGWRRGPQRLAWNRLRNQSADLGHHGSVLGHANGPDGQEAGRHYRRVSGDFLARLSPAYSAELCARSSRNLLHRRILRAGLLGRN